MDIKLPGYGLIDPPAPGPNLDPRVASQASRALGSVGEGISDIGSAVANIAAKVTESQMRKKLGDFENALTQAQSEASASMISNPGKPDTWLPDYQQRLEKVRDAYLKEASLRETQAITQSYNQFAARTTGTVLEHAALASFQNEKTTYANLVSQGESTGDEDLRQKGLQWADVHLPSGEAASLRDASDKRSTVYGLTNEIQQDPMAWEGRLSSPEEAAKYGVTRDSLPHLRSVQEAAQRDVQGHMIDRMNDRISSDPTVTPEILDRDFAALRPAVRAIGKNSLRERDDAAVKAFHATTGYEAQTIGRVNAMALDWSPKLEGYDERLAEMTSAIRSLPESSGARSELADMLQRKKAGAAEEVKTSRDLVKKIITDRYSSGGFGEIDLPTTYSQPLGRAVAAGALRNPDFLQRVGLSPDQAKAVASSSNEGWPSTLRKELEKIMPADEAKNYADTWAKKNDDDSRKEALRIFYDHRAGAPGELSPFESSFVQAVVDGKPDSFLVEAPSVEYAAKAEASKQAAMQKYGEALQRLDQWARTNPSANPAEVERMAVSINGESGRKQLLDGQAMLAARAASPLTIKNDADIGPDLIETVKKLEAGGAPGGYFAKAYADHGQNSIGFGSRAKSADEVITKDEAERRLKEELAMHRGRVDRISKAGGYDFTDHEKDSLSSFDYNTGSLEELLLQHGHRSKKEITDAMLKYVHTADTKQVLPGLVRRRQIEAQIFTQGFPQAAPPPVR